MPPRHSSTSVSSVCPLLKTVSNQFAYQYIQRSIWRVVTCCILLQVFIVIGGVFSVIGSKVQAKWELQAKCESYKDL